MGYARYVGYLVSLLVQLGSLLVSAWLYKAFDGLLWWLVRAKIGVEIHMLFCILGVYFVLIFVCFLSACCLVAEGLMVVHLWVGRRGINWRRMVILEGKFRVFQRGQEAFVF